MLSKKLDTAIKKIPRILTESSDLVFKTEIEDIDYQPDPKALTGILAVSVRKVTVVWELDIDQKDWGIREFLPEIKEVYGLKEFEPEDPDKKDWEEDVQWNVKDYTVTFETEKMGGGFRPIKNSIDEEAKKITVIFGEGLL